MIKFLKQRNLYPSCFISCSTGTTFHKIWELQLPTQTNCSLFSTVAKKIFPATFGKIINFSTIHTIKKKKTNIT